MPVDMRNPEMRGSHKSQCGAWFSPTNPCDCGWPEKRVRDATLRCEYIAAFERGRRVTAGPESEPIAVEHYVRCGGCDRFLMESRTLAIREVAGMRWAKKEYLFRPWASRILTRTSSVGVITVPDGGSVPITETAHACSMACIERVVTTWTYDARQIEVRAIPNDGFLSHIELGALGGRDIVMPALGFCWPAPDLPSDAWGPPPKRDKRLDLYRAELWRGL